jgi:hypothetical protein
MSFQWVPNGIDRREAAKSWRRSKRSLQFICFSIFVMTGLSFVSFLTLIIT